jgi:hypothetical protein
LWVEEGLSVDEQFVTVDGALLRFGDGTLARWG